MVFLITLRFVVPARDIKFRRQIVFDRLIRLIDSRGNRAVIETADNFTQFPCHGRSFRQILLVDFVADTPEYYTGMVAIALHEINEIALVPLGIFTMIIIIGLAGGPAVECFVDHVESEFVAEVEQFRVRHVVRGADRVAAHLFQQAQAVKHGGSVECRAERTEIVVQTDPFQALRTPVDAQAAPGVELHFPESAVDGLHIFDFSILQQRDGDRIKLRGIGRPQPESRHRQA